MSGRLERAPHALRQRVRDLVGTDRADRELRDEIAHHLELETARQIDAGCDPVTARERAIARFGNRTLITEATRAERGARPLEGAMQDLRWALRSLWKNSGFTVLALFTLSLGIGATTIALTVLDTVLLRPLPHREPDRLVLIRERTNKQALLAHGERARRHAHRRLRPGASVEPRRSDDRHLRDRRLTYLVRYS